MKKILFILCVLMTATYGSAQDVIILKNGDEIQAKVTEIHPLEIKYKRFNHLNEPIVTIAKKDIFMIRYENGMKEVIKLSIEQEKSEDQIQQPDEKTNNKKETISQNPPPTSKVIFKYSGKKFLNNPTIRFYCDVIQSNTGLLSTKFEGEEVGSGNVKSGFEIEFDTTPGTHNSLLLLDGKKFHKILWSGTIEINEANKTYIGVFKYNKLVGIMFLDSFKEI